MRLRLVCLGLSLQPGLGLRSQAQQSLHSQAETSRARWEPGALGQDLSQHPPPSVSEAENWATQDSFLSISQDPRLLIPSPLRCKCSWEIRLLGLPSEFHSSHWWEVCSQPTSKDPEKRAWEGIW